jgi:hypothetical protein
LLGERNANVFGYVADLGGGPLVVGM